MLKNISCSVAMAAMLVGGAVIANAQTIDMGATTTMQNTTTVTSTYPGVPNTGAGGDAGMNGITLGLSAIGMAGAAAYLVREIKRKTKAN